MVSRDNVVTTETAAPRKKAPVKKAPVAKEKSPIDRDNDGLVDDGKKTERSVKLAAVSSDTESLVIYFESLLLFSPLFSDPSGMVSSTIIFLSISK